MRAGCPIQRGLPVKPLPTPRTTYVIQGEFKASRDPQEVFSTVLGSCVAACFWDQGAMLGGMNHFLLPFGPDEGGSRSMRYGVHAMEMLINSLLRLGARRREMQAKLFGGARISTNLRDVGAANIAFAREFLRAEEIPCMAESVGGTMARRVVFYPTTGNARLLVVPNTALDTQVPQKIELPAVRRDDVVLF